MVVTISSVLRATLAVFLLGTIMFSAFAPPPSERARRIRPSRLIVTAVALYALGVVLAMVNQFGPAGFTCVTGIALFAVATWLSRPADSGEPPSDGRDDGEPPPEPPVPRGPDDALVFDWDTFERELHTYADELHTPA